MNETSERRLIELHPTLASKIRELAALFEAGNPGLELRVTQGFRTWAQQHALFIQGRSELVDVNACRANCGMPPIPEDQNRRVTDADSGYSWHNYGLAADVAPFKDGFPIWDEKNPAWAEIVKAGEDLLLRSGASWHDMPHFEWTGKFGPKPPDIVIQTYQEANVNGSGSRAVWDLAFG